MATAARQDGGDQLVTIAGRRLRVSNLEKVMYPAAGTTKGEVLDYYTRIAPFMIPHVSGRPATRKRWVHGVGMPGHPLPSFFAKDIGAGAPSWVPRQAIVHSDGAKEAVFNRSSQRLFVGSIVVALRRPRQACASRGFLSGGC